MKYRVSVANINFTFDRGTAALHFAEQSKLNAENGARVIMEFIKEGEEKADQAKKPNQQVTVTSLVGGDSQTSHNPRGIGVTWG